MLVNDGITDEADVSNVRSTARIAAFAWKGRVN